MRAANQPASVRSAHEGRAAVEGVNAAIPLKTDRTQHLLHRPRRPPDHPDLLAHMLRKQRGVDRRLRKKAAYELHVLAAQLVGLPVSQARKIRAQTLPEIAGPVGVKLG